MAEAEKQQPTTTTERTFGGTTYIVTAHFQETGSTAVEKIKRLIDLDTKAGEICRKS